MWSKMVLFWGKIYQTFIPPNEGITSSAEEQLASDSLVHLQ
jgi:hypothetical protein